MSYPPRTTTHEAWREWIDSVAPYRGPCHPELHPDMRFLASTADRELAAISASGIVGQLRKQGVIR